MTSSAPRFDMYTLVHKGQRRRLFELTGLAGQLAADDAAAHQALAAEVGAFLDTIEEHGQTEDQFLVPLYVTCAPELATSFAAEHRQLDGKMRALRDVLGSVLAAPSAAQDLRLYRALAAFTAAYLVHVDLEESSMPTLWAAYDDATLAKVQGALVAAHKPQTVMANLKTMLPAASTDERVRFLSGLKRTMPAPAFAGMRANIEGLLPAAEWQRIDA